MIGGPIGWPIGGIIVAEDARSAELAVTLDDATLASTGVLPLTGDAAITLDGVGLSFTGAIALQADAAITLDDATLAATGAVALTGTLSATLDDATLAATGAIDIKATLTVTLDDLSYLITGGPELSITDLEVLQLPVDCILAGQQHYKQSGREYEIRPMNKTERTWCRHSGVRALKGGRPSFTTTTNNRGYD